MCIVNFVSQDFLSIFRFTYIITILHLILNCNLTFRSVSSTPNNVENISKSTTSKLESKEPKSVAEKTNNSLGNIKLQNK